MKRAHLILSAILLASLGAPTVWAHHSAAAMDFGNTVEIEGIVKLVEVVNPHTKWILEVTDEKGTREITFEGHSRNNVYRAGYRDGIVNVGEKVTVTVAPMRDGSDGGYVTAFRTEDGRSVGLAN
jgi:Family of unknown function (DUF6152)